jgi:hypothetical protein
MFENLVLGKTAVTPPEFETGDLDSASEEAMSSAGETQSLFCWRSFLRHELVIRLF